MLFVVFCETATTQPAIMRVLILLFLAILLIQNLCVECKKGMTVLDMIHCDDNNDACTSLIF